MPFDGFVMAAVASELKTKILSGRLVKIYQPTQHLVILRVKKGPDTFNLLLSAHPVTGRIHLTSISRENPLQPPVFCMVLRKHLEGGRIIEIIQDGLERVLKITVEAYDELGRHTEKNLIIEIMGKHSNIILVNPQENTILDGIHRYTHAVSRHREVLPGKIYTAPPSQNKSNPCDTTEEEFRAELLSLPLATRTSKGIVQKFTGFSPFLAQEITARAGLPENTVIDDLGDYDLIRLWQAFQEITGSIKNNNFRPTIVKYHHELHDFHCILPVQFPSKETEEFSSVSEALDYYYATKEQLDLFFSRQRELLKVAENEIERMEKKLSAQMDKLTEIEDAEKLRLFGELITANMYKLSRGMKKAALENFYFPGDTVEVPLDPRLTPAQNSQFYFKKYNKAKSSKTLVQEQLEKGRDELHYLESVAASIEQSLHLKDLEEIRNEMVDSRYLKSKPQPKNKVPPKTISQPLSFVSKDNYTIMVGKNNKQNDLLTLKIANKDDLWLHTKDIHGSHVVIRKKPGEEIPFSTIEEGAKLAAFFSKARFSSKVPVDYTTVRQVKKPKGAKPGMVIYFEQKTLYVTPENLSNQTTNTF